MDNKNVQELLQEIEREIKDLKVAASIPPTVKTYWATFIPSSTSPITITYGEGRQPIISMPYSWYSSIMGNIQNNTQVILHSSQTPLELTVVSTRPILSITQ